MNAENEKLSMAFSMLMMATRVVWHARMIASATTKEHTLARYSKPFKDSGWTPFSSSNVHLDRSMSCAGRTRGQGT